MGSVQRRDNGRWKARYRGPDGRERSKTFDKKIDAERWLTVSQADRARGLWVDPALGRVTVSDWADRWLSSTVHLKPSTRASYESLLTVHVLPEFGSVELSRVDQLSVKDWVASLQAGGSSPARIRQARQVLNALMGAAVDSGRIGRNPVAGVKTPRREHREMRFLSASQVEDLVRAAGEQYATLLYLLAYGGLRWGEAAALRRSRCDILRSRIEVAESQSEVGGKVAIGPTKTYRRRTVVLPAFLSDRIAAELVGADASSDPLVFRSPSGGVLRHSNFSSRVWKPALERAGLPRELRIHDLRHTAAALLIQKGAHPKFIQSYLGHSSIMVTMDRYGHLFPTSYEELAGALQDTYERASG